MEGEYSFKNEVEFFAKMTAEDRVKWNQQVQNEQQSKEKFDPYIDHYPHIENWIYKGIKYTYYVKDQTQQPKALFLYFHGYGGYGDNSGYFAKIISENVKELTIAALDFKNFGRSESPVRGYIESF